MLRVRPITFREACAWIEQYHRHNKPPRGMKFCLSVRTGDGRVHGVASCGRPIARHDQDDVTVEINRTCTDGTPNANSMLYGACRRVAFAMGYDRVITFTQGDESGASLRAAGFIRVRELKPRKNWAESSQRLRHVRDADYATGGVPRVRWEAVRGPAA